MRQFILTTDTSCDIKRKELNEMEIPYIPLSFTIDGETFYDEFNEDYEYKAFYDKIRGGAMPITSQISAFLHEEFFEGLIEKGEKAIVHLTLSSGLSATYESAVLAADNVMERHQHVKIYIVDTLAATQGHAMLLDEARILRDSDKTAKEVAAELNAITATYQHWIAVDDLQHLKRGGRVSAVSAAIGGVLKIKPILIINNIGKLAVVAKAMGRQKALMHAINMIEKNAIDLKNQVVYIAHADCIEDAEKVKAMLIERNGCEVRIGWIGPVIGAHTGCGTLGIIARAGKRLDNK